MGGAVFMMYLYRLLSSTVHALVYPYGRIKAFRGNQLWRGRLALLPQLGPKDVWLHAASVGEVKVVGTLTDYLLRQRPSLALHVTVTTSAGFKTADSVFGQPVTLSYLPIDSTRLVRRTLKLIDPRMIVIAETEIWPNLVTEAAKANIPVVLINGRMSQSAFSKYKLCRKTLSRLLAGYDRFFFKTDEDRLRYRHFGVPDDKSVVAGDIKFDAPLMQLPEGRKAEIRHTAGIAGDAFMFVGGSTRPGEEDMLITAYQSLRPDHPQLRLVLAPRHLDRLGDVKALLEQKGLPYSIYGKDSAKPAGSAQHAVLVDQMGILNDLYSAADLAFVGGTLVDIGGHNVLEPVWARTPVVFGPHLDNVKEGAEYIIGNDLGAMVENADDLRAVVDDVISGRRRFAIKTDADQLDSATSHIGHYILERLKYA
jgi:3-deoxy-D-manno-octulosonic-acid transferase